MKKIFLFIGVFTFCLIVSCSKDGVSDTGPVVVLDSFLLHPPAVLDSLPIPLTIGSWWKYQRTDSSLGGAPVCCVLKILDSSNIQVTVIGKSFYVNTVNEIKNNIITRTRYDTVKSFLLETKNLSKGTIEDTTYCFYYDGGFKMLGVRITVPLLEGKQSFYGENSYSRSLIVKKNIAVTILNNVYNNSIYSEDLMAEGWPRGYKTNLNYYLQPGIGFVYRRYEEGSYSQYTRDSRWKTLRMIDYHLAP